MVDDGPGAPTFLWHAYPLGLLGTDQTGADRTCRRSLRELVDLLPHVRALGADGLLLGPVFDSLSHGYDTVDHRRVDQRLGTGADLDALIGAAAEQGVGIVLDGVFAYASRRFHGLAEPWFLRDAAGELVPWRVPSLVTPDPAAPGYRRYVADVLTAWLDRGIAGWRLDSAWSLPNGFWRPVLAEVRRRHPTAWFLGQVFDDDLAPVVNAAGYSTATEYALMHGVREWLAGGSADRMAATLRVHARNCSRTAPHTFLGNHDFARLADAVPAHTLPAAFALLLALPGVPAIYCGDEVAATSRWSPGGDDALLRPPMRAADLAAGELPATVQELGTARRARPWLTSATLSDVYADADVLTCTSSGSGRSLHLRIDRRRGSWRVDG